MGEGHRARRQSSRSRGGGGRTHRRRRLRRSRRRRRWRRRRRRQEGRPHPTLRRVGRDGHRPCSRSRRFERRLGGRAGGGRSHTAFGGCRWCGALTSSWRRRWRLCLYCPVRSPAEAVQWALVGHLDEPLRRPRRGKTGGGCAAAGGGLSVSGVTGGCHRRMRLGGGTGQTGGGEGRPHRPRARWDPQGRCWSVVVGSAGRTCGPCILSFNDVEFFPRNVLYCM